METVVLEKTDVKSTFRKTIKVLMFDDDSTYIGFVVEVLQIVFGKTFEEANLIAKSIDKAGKGGYKVVAEYTSRSIANSKVAKAMKMARQQGYNEFEVKTLD